jgi:hypothetical protein
MGSSRSNEWWEERNERQAALIEELSAKQLYEQTSSAKDGKVIAIRKAFEQHRGLSDKQRAVLAGWLAEREMEDAEDEES